MVSDLSFSNFVSIIDESLKSIDLDNDKGNRLGSLTKNVINLKLTDVKHRSEYTMIEGERKLDFSPELSISSDDLETEFDFEELDYADEREPEQVE